MRRERLVVASVVPLLALLLAAQERPPAAAPATAPATRPATAPATRPALGTFGNPVKCDHPQGERAYLRRLRDAAGEPVKFVRLGSFDIGPYGHILDGYEVTSSDGTSTTVYMDMYFPKHVEKEPVPGFTIVDP